MTREFRIITSTGEVRVTGDAALASDYDLDLGERLEYRTVTEWQAEEPQPPVAEVFGMLADHYRRLGHS